MEFKTTKCQALDENRERQSFYISVSDNGVRIKTPSNKSYHLLRDEVLEAINADQQSLAKVVRKMLDEIYEFGSVVSSEYVELAESELIKLVGNEKNDNVRDV